MSGDRWEGLRRAEDALDRAWDELRDLGYGDLAERVDELNSEVRDRVKEVAAEQENQE